MFADIGPDLEVHGLDAHFDIGKVADAARGRLLELANERLRFGYLRLFECCNPRQSAQVTKGLGARLDERPVAGSVPPFRTFDKGVALVWVVAGKKFRARQRRDVFCDQRP